MGSIYHYYKGRLPLTKIILIYLSALGLSCDMRDPVPWSRIKRRPPAWGVRTSPTGARGKRRHRDFFTRSQSVVSTGKKVNLICYYIIIIFHILMYIIS